MVLNSGVIANSICKTSTYKPVEIFVSTGKVKLTAAVPMYRSADIAWLAMEGLCNQVGVDFEWELVICEEVSQGGKPIPEHQVFGERGIALYRDRLREQGCVRIKYLPLEDWIPLSDKWVKMAKESDSELFLLVATDNYSPDTRLKVTAEELIGNRDWFQWSSGPFYDIPTESIRMFRRPNSHPCALFMATRTKYVQRLKSDHRRKGIDGWMNEQIRRKIKRMNIRELMHMEGVNQYGGMHTNGRNKISTGRRSFMKPDGEPRPPFFPTKTNLQDCLPDAIVNRLIEMKHG